MMLLFGEGEKPDVAKKQMREDLYVHTACAAHDCQNALKWGVLDAVTDTQEVFKNLITLASLRNSYNLLFTRLHGFLRDRLRFDVNCQSD